MLNKLTILLIEYPGYGFYFDFLGFFGFIVFLFFVWNVVKYTPNVSHEQLLIQEQSTYKLLAKISKDIKDLKKLASKIE